MAGRGRGRGKTVSFDVQALGFGRGEALPTSCQQPPPLFPIQEFKPVPLLKNEDLDYLLALKQEFMTTLRKSVYHLKASEKKRDIERYSDKYQLNQADGHDTFQPDWSRLPAELKIKAKRPKVKSSVRPNLSAARKKLAKDTGTEDIAKTLETLEKKEVIEAGEEETEKEEKEKEGDEEEEEELDEGEYDDEELEEENDYGQNYFDNGEGYGDDDGDDDEGPTY